MHKIKDKTTKNPQKADGSIELTLEDGTTIMAKVTGIVGWSGPVVQPLDPPENHQSTAAGPSSLLLTWDAPATGVGRAVLYRIYNAADNSVIATVDASVYQYQWIGLETDTGYTTYLKSVDSQGVESLPSNNASATTDAEVIGAGLLLDSPVYLGGLRLDDPTKFPPVIVVNPPVITNVSSASATSLLVSYTAPSTGVTPQSYEVDRSIDDDQNFVFLASVPPTGSFTNQGLETGRTYFYRMRSVYNTDVSANSNALSGIPTAPGGWQLPVGYYIPAKMPMRLVAPRDADHVGVDEGYNLAHPRVTYSAPIAVQGGARPFHFELITGPTGLDVLTETGTPQSDGIVVWSNPTAGSHAVQVNVHDQDGNVLQVNWTIHVRDDDTTSTDFYFITPTGTGIGSYNDPGGWGTALDQTGKMVICRAGTYPVENGNVSLVNIKGLIGMPGELATMNLTTGYLHCNGTGLLMSNLDIDGSTPCTDLDPTDPGEMAIYSKSRNDRTTYYNLRFLNQLHTGQSWNDACLHHGRGGVYRENIVVKNCTTTNCQSHLVTFYETQYAVVEGCRRTDGDVASVGGGHTTDPDIYFKNACMRCTAAYNTFLDTVRIRTGQIGFGCGNHGAVDLYGYVEACYNNLKSFYSNAGSPDATCITVAEYPGSTAAGPNNLTWAYRNTYQGCYHMFGYTPGGGQHWEHNSLYQNTGADGPWIGYDIANIADNACGSNGGHTLCVQGGDNASIRESAGLVNASGDLLVQAYLGKYGHEIYNPGATPGTFIVQDGFEDGDLNLGTGTPDTGFTWTQANFDGGASAPVVTANNPQLGTYSCEFPFGSTSAAGQARSELRFALGGQYTTLWTQFDLWIPPDFDLTPRIGQQKLFVLNDSTSTYSHRTGIITQLRGYTADTAFLTFSLRYDRHDSCSRIDSQEIVFRSPADTDTIYDGWENANDGAVILTAADKGTWVRFKFMNKVASSAAYNPSTYSYYADGTPAETGQLIGWGNDGEFRVYKNGVLYGLITGLNNHGSCPAGVSSWGGGYILGAKNDGYNVDTTLFIDNVIFSTTEPGAIPSSSVLNESFESGSIGYGSGNPYPSGFYWENPAGGEPTSIGDGPPSVVADTTGRSSYVMQFPYGYCTNTPPANCYAWSEQRFQLGSLLQELYIQWDVYYPPGCHIRDYDANANAMKFMTIWSGGAANYDPAYNNHIIGMHAAAGDTGDGWLSWSVRTNIDQGYSPSSEFWPLSQTTYDYNGWCSDGTVLLYDKSVDAGQWVTYKVRLKTATNTNAHTVCAVCTEPCGTAPSGAKYTNLGDDGVFEMWKNGVKIFSITDLPNHSLTRNGYEMGYILGFANQGFAADTTLLVDNVIITTEPI